MRNTSIPALSSPSPLFSRKLYPGLLPGYCFLSEKEVIPCAEYILLIYCMEIPVVASDIILYTCTCIYCGVLILMVDYYLISGGFSALLILALSSGNSCYQRYIPVEEG